MTRPLRRAALSAAIAVLVSAIASAIALLVLVGVPGSREAAAEFQQQAVGQIVMVDLVVGALVLFVAGWLAARPLTGHAALMAGLMTGLLYILVDLLIVFLFGNAERLNLQVTGLSYAVKVAAALLGGFVASRSPEIVEDEPEPVSLDKP